MTRTVAAVALTALIAITPAAPSEAGEGGLITLQSNHSVTVTIDRLEAVLKDSGMTVFARVPHHDGAANVALVLRPTELLIFGNPKVGTLLMHSDQRAAIDLPMKALAWEAADGTVWLTYNDPAYIARRHGVTDKPEVVEKMRGALKKFTAAAVE